MRVPEDDDDGFRAPALAREAPHEPRRRGGARVAEQRFARDRRRRAVGGGIIRIIRFASTQAAEVETPRHHLTAREHRRGGVSTGGDGDGGGAKLGQVDRPRDAVPTRRAADARVALLVRQPYPGIPPDLCTPLPLAAARASAAAVADARVPVRDPVRPRTTELPPVVQPERQHRPVGGERDGVVPAGRARDDLYVIARHGDATERVTAPAAPELAGVLHRGRAVPASARGVVASGGVQRPGVGDERRVTGRGGDHGGFRGERIEVAVASCVALRAAWRGRGRVARAADSRAADAPGVEHRPRGGLRLGLSGVSIGRVHLGRVRVVADEGLDVGRRRRGIRGGISRRDLHLLDVVIGRRLFLGVRGRQRRRRRRGIVRGNDDAGSEDTPELVLVLRLCSRVAIPFGALRSGDARLMHGRRLAAAAGDERNP